MTATTATPLAVLTGLALSHPLNLSFHSSGTAESTSVNRGIADKLYFLAYLSRRELTLGTTVWEVELWVDIRSLTIAETHRRCSSDCDWGGGAIILVDLSRVVSSELHLSNDQRKSLLPKSHVILDEYTKPAPFLFSCSLSFFKHRDPPRPSCYCKMIRVDSRGLHSWSSDYLRSKFKDASLARRESWV